MRQKQKPNAKKSSHKKSSRRIHKHVACGFNMIFTPNTEKRLRGGKKEYNKTWFCVI
jgi:hypothetical protein